MTQCCEAGAAQSRTYSVPVPVLATFFGSVSYLTFWIRGKLSLIRIRNLI